MAADPDDLVRAIVDRLPVRFVYGRQPRTVQPAALGHHVVTGALSLRGYQTGGRSNSRPPPFWTIFPLDEIDDLEVVDAPFVDDPPGYATGERPFDAVIAQL